MDVICGLIEDYRNESGSGADENYYVYSDNIDKRNDAGSEEMYCEAK